MARLVVPLYEGLYCQSTHIGQARGWLAWWRLCIKDRIETAPTLDRPRAGSSGGAFVLRIVLNKTATLDKNGAGLPVGVFVLKCVLNSNHIEQARGCPM